MFIHADPAFTKNGSLDYEHTSTENVDHQIP